MSWLYQTVSSGLAATAPDDFFAVTGAGTMGPTIYQKVSGAAVLVSVLASESALDRLGRFIPAVANVDNSVAINAALALPGVAGVILPPGDIRVDHAITLTAAMSGKFVRGSGMGATRLVRTNNIAGSTYFDKAGVIVRGATGCRVSDLTFVSPKVADKVQGVWFTEGATLGFCERVEAINCGYAFWAHEFASFITFRDVRSLNANVHFETTRATDILFEDMFADDGDTDNPLGVEATWHCLFGSKRITFRNGRHRGRGQPFLVVADSGSGDEGLIDQVRFENLRSKQTDAKIAFFVSRINSTASVGRIDMVDCDLDTTGGGGIPMQVQLGTVFARGGQWRTNSQENCIVLPGATLEWIDPDMLVANMTGATGSFFGGNGTTVLRGSARLESLTPLIRIGNVSRVTGDVRYIAPAPQGVAFTPPLGMASQFVFAADRQYAFTQILGQGPTDGRLQLALANGATYRVLLRGQMKKSANGQRNVGVYIDGLGGTLLSGELVAQIAPAPAEAKSYTLYANGRTVAYDATMSAAGFTLTMLVRGTGGTMTLSAPAGDIILAAGSEFSIERIG